MERIRSALFLDFDNIFGGLLEVDREAALALAERPQEFVDYLQAMDEAAGTKRALLVRRVYLNPKGSVLDNEIGNDQGRLYLNRFRPHLMRAGFEVIDCPALTSRQKNAADIRMVLDVLDLLSGPDEYDEFIIASSDADFTPLLVRLRAKDKRTIVLTAGSLAPPYRAIADRHVDEQALISLLTHTPDWGTDSELLFDGDRLLGDALSSEPSISMAPSSTLAANLSEAEAEAIAAVTKALKESAVAVNLATLGNHIHATVGGDVVRRTNWFGAGSLRSFISENLQDVSSEGHFVWEPDRHPTPPAQAMNAPDVPRAKPQSTMPELPACIAEVCAVSDMPRLPFSTWPRVFETLERYAASHQFSLTEATSWSRDELATNCLTVGRQPLSFIVRGCMFGGASLAADPPPTAEQLCHAFAASMVDRSRSAGLDLDESDVADLGAWLTGDEARWSPVLADLEAPDI